MEVVSHFHPGEVIIREGDLSRGFYILQSGELEVYKDRRKVARISAPGSVFGEMAGLLDEPRTCTVVARVSSYVIPVPST